MTPEQIIYSALSADSAIAAIVGTRISPMKSLDDGVLPCITYHIIGAKVEYTQDGPEVMQDPAVQIDLWADLNQLTASGQSYYEVLSSLRLAVLNCLYGADSPAVSRYFFVTDDGTDIIEPKAGMARKKIEATLWHKHDF